MNANVSLNVDHDPLRELEAVRYEMQRASSDSGRLENAVTLVAVSKTVDANRIIPFLQAGQGVFGENYVQEALNKWPSLKEHYPHVELHMIGPLQSNKVKEALTIFDVIETLDRPSLAQALSKEIHRRGSAPRLFIQVNIGAEPQKGGVSVEALPSFLKECQRNYNLVIDGLMCIPPFDQPPSPYFALLRKLAHDNGLKNLSMGMSADFEQAIMLGATHIRVGTRLFGAR
jgi:pyridoxal phosphate enzyme (YggS family)